MEVEYISLKWVNTDNNNCFIAGNLYFVGHAGTLDSCSRQLTGKAPRNDKELQQLVQKVPYASVSIVEEKPDRTWQLTDPPFSPLRHCDNLSFDWHVLLS